MSHPSFPRFTDHARKVFQLANQEARRLNHDYIGTGHVLLGLVLEGTGVAANTLTNLNLDLRTIRQDVEKARQKRSPICSIGILPQTPKVENVIEYAAREARSLNHNYVGTEHILLGLLREQESVAAEVLMNHGLTLEQARTEIQRLLRQPEQDSGEEHRLPQRGPFKIVSVVTALIAAIAVLMISLFIWILLNR